MLGLSTSSFRPRHVHIIGGGLAGLACALKLKEQGIPLTLYEAAIQAGGRCRSYEDKQLGSILDNGNHLILRGNKAAWRYIKKLGSFGEFYAMTPDYVFCDTKAGVQWKIRPPFVKDAWRALSLLTAFKGHTVAQCFNEQTEFYRQFIEPLCIAALNTHPKEASAQMLRNVMLRMLLPNANDYLQIRTNFNRALINPALHLIGKQSVELTQRLREVEIRDRRITGLRFTTFHREIAANDYVVLALPPDAVATLIPSLELPAFKTHAIINGHFKLDTDDLAPRLLGVTNSPLHWVFIKDGLLSTTTSHAERTALWEKPDIAERLWKEIGKCYPKLAYTPLPPHRIVTEKRATIAASPKNLAKRPNITTRYSNLLLASDWMDSPLPACLESAIRSGEKAAKQCLIRRGDG